MVLIDFVGCNVNQYHLEAAVRALFNGERILTNARKDAHIKKPTTGFFLELDLWIPELQLSFEFQDPYHYSSTWDSQIPLAVTTYYDDYKQERIQSRGDTLVRVPYWWDGKHESLVATVHFLRPDLLVHTISPIPLNPSFDSVQPGIVPDVGELMLASFPMSKNFHESISAAKPWWMGEKYDGVRILWNPDRDALFTRAGYRLQVLPEFDDELVDSFIDGEIWFGRGCFVEAQRMLQAHVHTVNWAHVRLIGFDDPTSTLRCFAFEKRYGSLLTNVPNEHPFIIVAPRALCTNKKHLSHSVEKIVEDEGEGVILRKPKSMYEHGRSTSLLKVKAVRGDKEAMVVSVESDGSCQLKLPSGILFCVDSNNISEDVVLQEGDVVTFSFETYSRNSAPVKPFLYRIRTDLSWEEVVYLSTQDVSAQQTLNDTSQKATGVDRVGDGKSERRKRMRMFFEKFARKRDLDPLHPETWYSVSRKAVLNTQGANPILSHYKGSLIRALVNLFPELVLDQSKFEILPQNFWGNVDNRRRFFLKLAKYRGFDPLVASNWYSVTGLDVHSRRGSTSVLSHYGGHFSNALAHLFPEMQLDKSLFASQPYNLFKNVHDRRKLFDEYALGKGFDPLVAANWYHVRRRDVLKMKGAKTILRLRRSNTSLRKLLPHLYPEVKFMDCHFTILPVDYWQQASNRRRFFENYAHFMSFDPLSSPSWYPVLNHLQTMKECHLAIQFYKKSLFKALVQLFPEVAWDWRKFTHLPHFWHDPDSRREVLIAFAREKGFDALVPVNWYNIPKEDIADLQGMKAVLQHHDGKFPQALVQLFPSIKWDIDKFLQKPNNYWKVDKHRRAFFDSFAKVKGFDPLLMKNWRSVSLTELASSKGGSTILRMYNGSMDRALMDTYSGVGWSGDTSDAISNKWAKPQNRRIFFEQYARDKGFDPLVPLNWYSVTYDNLKEAQGAVSVLRYYNNNLPTALLSLFPEVDLDVRNFSFTPRNYWNEAQNRKRFFTDFAARNMFDASLASNWYPIATAALLGTKGSASILHFYKGSFVKALVDLFPHMELDRRRFKHIP